MAATDTYATIEEPLEEVFSVWPMPKLHNEGQLPLKERYSDLGLQVG
jgi:hypothetical protein